MFRQIHYQYRRPSCPTFTPTTSRIQATFAFLYTSMELLVLPLSSQANILLVEPRCFVLRYFWCYYNKWTCCQRSDVINFEFCFNSTFIFYWHSRVVWWSVYNFKMNTKDDSTWRKNCNWVNRIFITITNLSYLFESLFEVALSSDRFSLSNSILCLTSNLCFKKWVPMSVRRSIRTSVCPFVRPSVCPSVNSSQKPLRQR